MRTFDPRQQQVDNDQGTRETDSKRFGITRRALGATRDFVDRYLTAGIVLAATLLLLIASWIYPPWFSHGRYASHAWYFIFDTNTGSMQIDFGRLLLINLIVAVPGGLLVWVISRSSAARRALARSVFYAMLVVPILAAVWLSAVLIFWQATEVASGDLVKITFSSVTSDDLSFHRVMIRNSLPRTVKVEKLKAWFYDAEGRPIASRAVSLSPLTLASGSYIRLGSHADFYPDTPLPVLPDSYKWTIEVSKAHYVR